MGNQFYFVHKTQQYTMFSRGIEAITYYVMMIYSLHFALMPSLLMMTHPETF